MLNVTESGDITLTIRGKLIATLYAPHCDTLTPKELVRWENDVRRGYYEDIKGYYCKENERNLLEAEAKYMQIYPNYPLKPLAAIETEYEHNRREAIDG